MSEAAALLRLSQKHEELQKRYDLLCKQIQCVGEAYQIEAGNPLIKLQRKIELEKHQNERDEIVHEMSSIELQTKQLRISAVYHALLNLDCIEHINRFAEFVSSHPAAAFVIHGYSKYGLKILIKRILQEISFTPPSPIRIDWTSIQRIFSVGNPLINFASTDVNPLWVDLSRRLNCSSLPQQIALKISQKLQKEHVVIILDRTDITCDFNAIIDDFWSNLIQTIQNSSEKSANLLVFIILVEDSDSCGFHFTEAHDASWQPQIPVKMPCVDKYCADDLNDWMNHVSGIIPLGKRRKPGIINDILKNTQDGLSDHVIRYICTDLCECEFDEGMLLKWLNC